MQDKHCRSALPVLLYIDYPIMFVIQQPIVRLVFGRFLGYASCLIWHKCVLQGGII